MYDFSLYEQEAYRYATAFYSSFLLPQCKYIYIGSYKTGSTSLLILMTKLARKMSELRDGSLRSSIPLPEIPLAEINQYAKDGYVIFSICRNPILKLFSGWSDKILAGNTTSLYLRQRYNLPLTEDYSIENIRQLFENFVEDLFFHRDPIVCNDKHWIQQHVGLLVEKIKYTEIVRFEELNVFIERLEAAVGRSQKPVEDLHLNRSDIPYCSDYITNNSLDMIFEIYDRDFSIFKYPRTLPIESYKAPNFQLLGLSREDRNYWYAQHKEQ